MINEMKYENQIWGEPIPGERLSTNGHYTGELVGGALQDATCEMTPHLTEETIVRCGTVLHDAIEGSTPKAIGGGKLFTFYLDTEYLTAEEGMTWDEWVFSEYNKTYTCEFCGETHLMYDSFDEESVRLTDGCNCENGGGRFDAERVVAYLSIEDHENMENSIGQVWLTDEINPNYFYGLE